MLPPSLVRVCRLRRSLPPYAGHVTVLIGRADDIISTTCPIRADFNPTLEPTHYSTSWWLMMTSSSILIRSLSSDVMAGRPPPNIDGMVSLKIDNLSYRTDIETLRRKFSKYGEIGDVYVPKDKYGGTTTHTSTPLFYIITYNIFRVTWFRICPIFWQERRWRCNWRNWRKRCRRKRIKSRHCQTWSTSSM